MKPPRRLSFGNRIHGPRAWAGCADGQVKDGVLALKRIGDIGDLMRVISCRA